MLTTILVGFISAFEHSSHWYKDVVCFSVIIT